VTIGIAAGALILLGHRSTTSARSPSTNQVGSNPATRAARGGPAPGGNQPAPVSAAQVAARLSLRAMPVAHYCAAPALRFVKCRPGQRPVVAQPQRLVELSFTARRAAGLHSWYAWDLTAPKGCGSSVGGPTRGSVPKGSRLAFDTLFRANCHGTVGATVLYFTEAPNADRERSALVGRSTLRLP
jgi:hypothetical protein